MLMCVLLHLLICTALRAHIIIVEALYKINYHYGGGGGDDDDDGGGGGDVVMIMMMEMMLVMVDG